MNKIIVGNSITLIKSIETASIHAIISDIPYGISYDDWDVLHNNTNSALGGASSAQLAGGSLFKRRGKPLNGWSEADKKIPLEYQNWCSSWASEWLRVLKPGASCFVFAGRRYAHRCIAALEDAGFTFKDMLAWEKMPPRSVHSDYPPSTSVEPMTKMQSAGADGALPTCVPCLSRFSGFKSPTGQAAPLPET